MKNKTKIAFIINPIAGRKKFHKLEETILNHLNTEVYHPEFYYTEHVGHASLLVNQVRNKGVEKFVAVGGDGTVNEVATAVFRLNGQMGIIPCGSGNGLARSLNIPTNKIKAINLLNHHRVFSIDVGSINDHYFFCTCGSGFDAKVGFKFSKQKTRGFLTYIKTTLREYNRYRPKKFSLKVNGEKMKKRAFLITVANAGQYGNNAYIAPKAVLDDGKLEVCIFKPFPWHASLILGIRLFNKTINKSKYIEILQANSVVFRKKKKYSFHIDGDPVKLQGPVKINIIPKALKVMVG